MRIAVFTPKGEFPIDLQKELSNLGEVVYTDSRRQYSEKELVEFAENSEIIAADPDNFGGFEKATPFLDKVIQSLPKLKGIALSTTSTEWVDLKRCLKLNVPVSNIPHYSTESVAEHALGLILCQAKNIIFNDRNYWLGKESKYGSAPGFELEGKTLGVIGLGSIGSRVAQLGAAIGMKVIGFNRTPRKLKNVKQVSLKTLLSTSDVISVHLGCVRETYHFIGEKEIKNMKKGIVVTDLVGPVPDDMEIVDKKAMAKALLSGRVRSYSYEAENLNNNPLSKVENAIGLKGFAWYTKDALDRAKDTWVENIISMAKGKPKNRVV